MTIEEKLTCLNQEIDALNSVVDSVLENNPGADIQGLKLQVVTRFERCEMVLKSVRRSIADKGKDDPDHATVRALRDRLSVLLDRYEGEPNSGRSQAAAS
jgi:hypothetical protein